jgi:host factor-I protein
MPASRPEGLPVPGAAPEGKKPALQDVFLAAASRQKEPMTIFLVNGVMLQGIVEGFDQFSILLERGGQVQIVYKHAVSTLQPSHALDLGGGGEGEGDAG